MMVSRKRRASQELDLTRVTSKWRPSPTHLAGPSASTARPAVIEPDCSPGAGESRKVQHALTTDTTIDLRLSIEEWSSGYLCCLSSGSLGQVTTIIDHDERIKVGDVARQLARQYGFAFANRPDTLRYEVCGSRVHDPSIADVVEAYRDRDRQSGMAVDHGESDDATEFVVHVFVRRGAVYEHRYCK